MTIYLVCKHQRFSDYLGSGIYKAFLIEDAMENKEKAKAIADRLNKKSVKYFYKIKKVTA
jgi:hypothetical protein